MYTYCINKVLPAKFYQKIGICFIAILLGIFLPVKKTFCAEDLKDEKYLQSLPDQSFAIIEKKMDGTVIRSLPHHDEQGNLVIPKVERALNQIFELEPKDQEKVRDHLLGDYYEYITKTNQ